MSINPHKIPSHSLFGTCILSGTACISTVSTDCTALNTRGSIPGDSPALREPCCEYRMHCCLLLLIHPLRMSHLANIIARSICGAARGSLPWRFYTTTSNVDKQDFRSSRLRMLVSDPRLKPPETAKATPILRKQTSKAAVVVRTWLLFSPQSDTSATITVNNSKEAMLSIEIVETTPCLVFRSAASDASQIKILLL
ncbi:uncharacterized protein LAESUDRAFT_414763 [Laetiporus sulphureus 93-53]|uniref:Uncharacterized protein n=1 Tax=Laetiporus sulphureus 93-53 TaxID=1314785 RepID=A0A165C855_9APHY|nr:uncharacterized protein LAESUDRAFT_414763 [Laetiporus sulphureus 93-53]KZT02368.1 hypothetical protein LAESUDRAFT_414763 [Laetiporus sulphureus 93-53]